MIRVCVIDDNATVVDSIRRYLRHEPDFRVNDVCSSTGDLSAHAGMIDLVLVNIHLPNRGAMAVITLLNSVENAPRIVLTGTRCPETEILPFLDKGIAGYVLAGSSGSEFAETLRMIHRGEVLLSPRLAATLMQHLVLLSRAYNRSRMIDPEVVAVRTLTSRECDVTELIGHGYSNQEIADHLSIEVGTVKNHVHNILRKLDVNSRRSAASKHARARREHVPANAPSGLRTVNETTEQSSDDAGIEVSRLPGIRRMPA